MASAIARVSMIAAILILCQSPAAEPPSISQHDVAPILLRRCAMCHGGHRQEGGLDLRSRSSMLRGGKSGPAILPGKPEESLLIRRVRAGAMPPRDRLVEASVKPIEANEIETIAKWINAGAPEVVVEPDVAGATPDRIVTDSDRNFWSFRPPATPKIPLTQIDAPARNPIDAFILTKLKPHQLTLSPEASRATLLRRVYYDLTGLPPSPDEVQQYLADDASDAYERLVDRLLASPQHGERWARHWLDVAGYADSEGKREQDLPRPNAWRYRDYVVRSFNADKPYDRFLMEQIAGDELADYRNVGENTPEISDNLIATAFLRMAPDATWANITGYLHDRIEVIADEMEVLGSAVMGLSIHCARCHNHKLEPIPQRDYFRLLDIFKGAFDEHDWLKPDVRPGLGPVSQDTLGGRLLPHVPSMERREWQQRQAAISKEIAELRTKINVFTEAAQKSHQEKLLSKTPAVLHEDLKAMLATPAAKRTAVQRYLAEKFEAQLRPDRPALAKVDPAFQKEMEGLEAQIRAAEKRLQPEPQIQALWDRGQPSPTYVYRRGDPLQPVALVGPGVPSVLTDGKTPFAFAPPWPNAKSTGRRLAFAKWLTRPDHPLTARVIVNRIWKHHFGAGIVATLGNFGRSGATPTHPELLDWLSQYLIQHGWSVKSLHRLIVTSAVYRQSSSLFELHQRLDPSNTLLSRMPMRRLDAEAVYDGMLQAAQQMDATPYGPADVVTSRPDGLVTPNETARGRRRMIYVQQTRKRIATHLEAFDFPQMNPNCTARRESLVATQALYMMNNANVEDLANRIATRIQQDAGADIERRIERTFLVCLSRPPDSEERRISRLSLQKLTNDWNAIDSSSADRRALASFCHAILNSAAFLFVD